MTAKWHSNEYDPRDRNTMRQLKGVNTDRALVGEDMVDQYTLKVGDLCFVAIGQVVNRRLNAVRYQPTACLVINSPVQTPALAAAVRRDWTDLSPKEHKESLIEDAMDKRWFSKTEALKRLLFYYPDDGEQLAMKLLNRPYRPAYVDGVTTNEQADLVRGLSAFRSDRFDRAILAIFRSIDLEKYEQYSRIDADNLALACIDRLVGKGFDNELAAYCEKRIKELQGKKREPAEDQQLAFLSERLERIQMSLKRRRV